MVSELLQREQINKDRKRNEDGRRQEELKSAELFDETPTGEVEHDRLGPISRFSPDMPSAEWQMEAALPLTRFRLSTCTPSFHYFSAFLSLLFLLSIRHCFMIVELNTTFVCPRESITDQRKCIGRVYEWSDTLCKEVHKLLNEIRVRTMPDVRTE